MRRSPGILHLARAIAILRRQDAPISKSCEIVAEWLELELELRKIRSRRRSKSGGDGR